MEQAICYLEDNYPTLKNVVIVSHLETIAVGTQFAEVEEADPENPGSTITTIYLCDGTVIKTDSIITAHNATTISVQEQVEAQTASTLQPCIDTYGGVSIPAEVFEYAKSELYDYQNYFSFDLDELAGLDPAKAVWDIQVFKGQKDSKDYFSAKVDMSLDDVIVTSEGNIDISIKFNGASLVNPNVHALMAGEKFQYKIFVDGTLVMNNTFETKILPPIFIATKPWEEKITKSKKFRRKIRIPIN